MAECGRSMRKEADRARVRPADGQRSGHGAPGKKKRGGGDLYRLVLGTSFGLGLIPFMPGTFGALPGLAVHWAVLSRVREDLHWWALAVVFVCVAAINHWLTPWATHRWANDDPKQFVLDEVAGYLIVPLVFPSANLWPEAVLGFVLFRAFDICKVPPARYFDRNVKGAWGILLDDVVSGVYAGLCLHVAHLCQLI